MLSCATTVTGLPMNFYHDPPASPAGTVDKPNYPRHQK